MAFSERSGGSGPHEQFLGIMKGSGIASLELSGFREKGSEEIKEWHRQGLGVAIGFPLRNNDGATVPGSFRGVMYALPLTGVHKEGHDKRILILSPSADHLRAIVVAPAYSSSPDEEMRQRADKILLERFNSLFNPSTEPFIVSPWKSSPTSDPFMDFFLHPSVLDVSIRYDRTPDEDILEGTILRALRVAQAMKAREIAADERLFADALNPNVITLFRGVNRKMNEQ